VDFSGPTFKGSKREEKRRDGGTGEGGEGKWIKGDMGRKGGKRERWGAPSPFAGAQASIWLRLAPMRLGGGGVRERKGVPPPPRDGLGPPLVELVATRVSHKTLTVALVIAMYSLPVCVAASRGVSVSYMPVVLTRAYDIRLRIARRGTAVVMRDGAGKTGRSRMGDQLLPRGTHSSDSSSSCL